MSVLRTVMTIDDFTPSDSGPWLTKIDPEDVPHVMPSFGPVHEISIDCWCHPIWDADYAERAVSHNVAQ